jgi:DNA-binding protein HU-beta
MTKPEFIAEVAKVAETTKVDAEKVVNAMLDTVQDTLAKGDSIQFVGFGTFEVKERAAREGINPRTKEKIQIAAKKAPGFKAGKKLKDAVAGA